MGNEISTAGGVVTIAVCATATVVTVGQVESVNNAIKACAGYTWKKAKETLVWHASKTVLCGATMTVLGVVAFPTRSEYLKGAAREAYAGCADGATKLAKTTVATGDGLLNGVPGVGHVKGVIHDICGDEEGARQAYFSANRTAGVVGGALVGSLNGPEGAVCGAIAGGAAMDGVHTVYASLKDGEYTPQGQIAGWTQVVTATNSEEVVGGIVDGVVGPLLDGLTSMVVYKTGGFKLHGKRLESKAIQLLDIAEHERRVAPGGQWMKMYEAAIEMNKKAVEVQGEPTVVGTAPIHSLENRSSHRSNGLRGCPSLLRGLWAVPPVESSGKTLGGVSGRPRPQGPPQGPSQGSLSGGPSPSGVRGSPEGGEVLEFKK